VQSAGDDLDAPEALEEAGREPALLLDALRHLDQVSEMKALVRRDIIDPLGEMLRGAGAMVGSAPDDVRFTAPVFPGCRLDYLVVEVGAHEAAMRYDVERSWMVARRQGKTHALASAGSSVVRRRLPGALTCSSLASGGEADETTVLIH